MNNPHGIVRIAPLDSSAELENLLYVRDYMKRSERPTALWIRTPLIPDATATLENVTAIASFIAPRFAGS
mgnify:CR=1 FL=1